MTLSPVMFPPGRSLSPKVLQPKPLQPKPLQPKPLQFFFPHWLLVILVLLAGAAITPVRAAALDGKALEAQVAAAQPGADISIPAGTFTISGLELPPGVNVHGAGYDQTTLVVNGQIGIHAKGAGGSSIRDLTVRDAASAGVQLDGCAGSVVIRVRAVRCLTGILVSGGGGNRVADCAAGENRTGIAVNGASASVVVNCTMARNSALGLSLSGTTDSAAFNNLIVGNGIGIYLADKNPNLVVDHNCYWGALIGKGKDTAMPTIFSWRDMERQDHHSVALAVSFSDPTQFVYKPTTAMPWSPDRSVAGFWAVRTLAGFNAPSNDIDRKPHTGGVGAWEASFTPDRPSDGKFTVQSPDGYKSAGLYDARDREVAWLFNMLPLPRGSYDFWLPTRDWQGRPIPAGQYTLKMSEADLSMKYVNSVGNNGVTPASEAYATTGISQVVYDSKDRPVLCLHWSESYRQFRSMDPLLQHERWMIPGCDDLYGTASDGQGRLFSVRDNDKDTYILGRVDEETGKYVESAPGEYGWVLKKADLGIIKGIAVLGGQVYAAAYDRGKLLVGDATNPHFDTSFDVSGALSPAADRVNNVVWVISDRSKVLGLDAKGAVKYTFAPGVPDLVWLAVNGSRMALVSSTTGKVYLYDLADPANPKLARTVGTGDGPYGPIRIDRFQFQTKDPTVIPGQAKVALDSQGNAAVTDAYGVKLFGWDGKPRRDFEGIWGQYMEKGASQPGGPLELIDLVSRRTMELDEKTGAWQWGTTYQTPDVKGFELDPDTGYFFIKNGKRFGVYKGTRVATQADGKVNRSPVFLIARYDTALATPVLGLGSGPDGKLARFDDFTKDFGAVANWTPVVDNQGKPLDTFMTDPLIPQASGDLEVPTNPTTLVTLKGLDANNAPVYDFANTRRIRLVSVTGGTITSPYDLKTKEDFPGWIRHGEIYADGSVVGVGQARKSAPNSSGFANWAGNFVAGFDPGGLVRWLQPMPGIKDPEGCKIVDDVSYTNSCPMSEIQIVDKDGLYLGETAVPRDLYWHGMWLDNTHQFLAFKGSQGQHYVVFGNFNDCTAWWMQVQGRDTIVRHQQTINITDATVAALAAEPEPPLYQAPENVTTTVKIVKLAAPMLIDGDLEKWRKILPTPQIIITPETGTGINGPGDCSALVRLAHEGGNLYVQVIRFDDVVAMFQPVAKFYKQDAIEMSINSFVKGIKLNVTHTRDLGDVIVRDGWFLKAKPLDPARAPRSITVLQNAATIPERKLIEQIYGVDLSNAKVIVSEFKVPMDDDTFEGRLDAKPNATSGNSMRLGIAIDDNDSPGADLQKMMVWPATYGTFSDISTSALVVFE